eukprot:401842_1
MNGFKIILLLITYLKLQFHVSAMVNGEIVSGNEYKWMASLRKDYTDWKFVINGTTNPNTFYKRFCGGSLISVQPIIILTAAHCVNTLTCCESESKTLQEFVSESTLTYELSSIDATDGHENMRNINHNSKKLANISLSIDLGRTKGLFWGNTYDETNDTFITLKVDSCDMIHVHENYDNAMEGFDIALINIPNDNYEKLDENYPIVEIPEFNMEEECCVNGDKFEAIGYGLNDDIYQDAYKTKTLEHIYFNYYSSDECVKLMSEYYKSIIDVIIDVINAFIKLFIDFEGIKRWYTKSIPTHKICLKGNNQDACQGDSGGPLFKNEYEYITVYGVASHVSSGNNEGDQCNSEGGNGNPTFYTSVGHYYQWINDTIVNGNMGIEC